MTYRVANPRGLFQYFCQQEASIIQSFNCNRYLSLNCNRYLSLNCKRYLSLLIVSPVRDDSCLEYFNVYDTVPLKQTSWPLLYKIDWRQLSSPRRNSVSEIFPFNVGSRDWKRLQPNLRRPTYIIAKFMATFNFWLLFKKFFGILLNLARFISTVERIKYFL